MSKRFARFNTLVVDHLVSRLDRTQKENFSECRLFDSDGSKYLLQREQEDPNKIRLSFSLAEFAANIAVAASLSTIAADLSAQHHRYCEMCTDVEGSYQLVLTIQLDTLQSENPALQLQYLQSIGCIRADILCWPLRLLPAISHSHTCFARMSFLPAHPAAVQLACMLMSCVLLTAGRHCFNSGQERKRSLTLLSSTASLPSQS